MTFIGSTKTSPQYLLGETCLKLKHENVSKIFVLNFDVKCLQRFYYIVLYFYKQHQLYWIFKQSLPFVQMSYIKCVRGAVSLVVKRLIPVTTEMLASLTDWHNYEVIS